MPLYFCGYYSRFFVLFFASHPLVASHPLAQGAGVFLGNFRFILGILDFFLGILEFFFSSLLEILEFDVGILNFSVGILRDCFVVRFTHSSQ